MGRIIQAINANIATILAEIASGIGQRYLLIRTPEANAPEVIPVQVHAQKHILRDYVTETELARRE